MQKTERETLWGWDLGDRLRCQRRLRLGSNTHRGKQAPWDTNEKHTTRRDAMQRRYLNNSNFLPPSGPQRGRAGQRGCQLPTPVPKIGRHVRATVPKSLTHKLSLSLSPWMLCLRLTWMHHHLLFSSPAGPARGGPGGFRKAAAGRDSLLDRAQSSLASAGFGPSVHHHRLTCPPKLPSRSCRHLSIPARQGVSLGLLLLRLFLKML